MRRVSHSVSPLYELIVRDEIYKLADDNSGTDAPTPDTTPNIDWDSNQGPSDMMGDDITGTGGMVGPTPKTVTPHTMPQSAPNPTPTTPSSSSTPSSDKSTTGKGGGGLLGDIFHYTKDIVTNPLLDAGAAALLASKTFNSKTATEEYPRSEEDEDEWCPFCGIVERGHSCKEKNSW